MTERFGFGDRVSLADGMAVSAGTVPSLSQLQSPAAVANLSFGQGTLMASPVQICRMMAVVANGGMLVDVYKRQALYPFYHKPDSGARNKIMEIF